MIEIDWIWISDVWLALTLFIIIVGEMTSIYVRGFPRRTGERDLETLFGTVGPVNDVRMVRDFAFIVRHHPSRLSRIRRLAKKLSIKWTVIITMAISWECKSQRKSPDPSRMTLAAHVEKRGIGTNHHNKGRTTVQTREEGVYFLK